VAGARRSRLPPRNPMVEPSWQQICAMGYEIPGIGVIGGDVVAQLLDGSP
jgi:hypothetical protein